LFAFYLFLFPSRDMNNDDEQQNKTIKKITKCSLLFSFVSFSLKFLKLFFWTGSFGDLEYIESNCFTQWTTFTNSYHVTDLYITKKNPVINNYFNENFPTENMDLNVRTYFCDVFQNDCIYVHNVNNLDGWQLFVSF
jgi:hypothetical protein